MTKVEDTLHRDWQTIVQKYTVCGITKPEDKLVAVSALAKWFQERLKDDYLAGLWRRSLPRSMLWCLTRKSLLSLKAAASIRPLTYRAPTWSWASIDSEVEFQLSTRRTSHVLVKVIDATTMPLTSDSTGQIIDGYLKLKTNLVRLTMYFINTQTVQERKFSLELWWENAPLTITMVPDTFPDPSAGTEELFMIPVAFSEFTFSSLSDELTSDKGFQLFGLLLKCSAESDLEYTRYGAFRSEISNAPDTNFFKFLELFHLVPTDSRNVYEFSPESCLRTITIR